MQYEKVIDGTIDVHNPINFCADKSRYLLAEIKSKYADRCFKGVYIVAIKSILNCGACHIVRTNSTGEGYIDVRFIADVVSYNRWDIITNITIVNRQQMLIGTTGRAVVSVLASKAAETVAVGQKIAVRVVLAQHTPLQSKISAVGTLLTCDQTAPAYKLRGSLDQTTRVDLEPMLHAVEAAMERRAELIKTRKADVWFFEQLLYAYRKKTAVDTNDSISAWDKGPVWEGPTSLQAHTGDMKSVLDIVHRVVGGETVSVTGTWTRPLSVYRSSPLVSIISSTDSDIEGNPRAVFAEFMKNILDFLIAVHELVEIYNTRELIDGHLNIWSVMRSMQKFID